MQHRGDKDTDRVFTAIVEPYVGEPFIADTRLLEVENNGNDAQKAVAVEVKTTNGHTDVVFADGQSEKTRKVGDAAFAAEFAAVSRDAKGLRLVSLVGGTLVETPLVALKLATRHHTGKVTDVDYLEKTFRIDAEWPAFAGSECALEIGSGEHWTTYMATKIAPDAKASLISLRNGATLYASRVIEVDEKSSTVYCALMLPFVDHDETAPVPGLHRGSATAR